MRDSVPEHICPLRFIVKQPFSTMFGNVVRDLFYSFSFFFLLLRPKCWWNCWISLAVKNSRYEDNNKGRQHVPTWVPKKKKKSLSKYILLLKVFLLVLSYLSPISIYYTTLCSSVHLMSYNTNNYIHLIPEIVQLTMNLTEASDANMLVVHFLGALSTNPRLYKGAVPLLESQVSSEE